MKLWLNVAEGAEYAGVCKDLTYDAFAAGQIRHIRIGGRRAIRMKRESIDAWFERQAVEAPAEAPQATPPTPASPPVTLAAGGTWTSVSCSPRGIDIANGAS